MAFGIAALLENAQTPYGAIMGIWRSGIWIAFFPVFIWMCKEGWLYWIQGLYFSGKKFVLLAIDVPKLNEQSMKAVEHFIATLHGAYKDINWVEKWWGGMFIDSFSLEIVSIDGYIQYFVFCDDYHVDLIKGSIFAQYPDAEIIEVEDYATNVPQHYPDEKYDMWGGEWVLNKSDVYPIKTYDLFEHSLTGVYADPLASVLELMSRIRPGEQVWIQLIINPIPAAPFREKCVEEVNKIIGRKEATKLTNFDYILAFPLRIIESMHNFIFNTEGWGEMPGTSEADKGNFMTLTGGEQQVVLAIQKKAAQLPFNAKFRFVYIAPKNTYSIPRVVWSMMGAMRQFSATDMNGFKWGKLSTVGAVVWGFAKRRKNMRKNNLMMTYKGRSAWGGEMWQTMSDAEIASIFHFPSEIVKTPLVAKTIAKKAEPPTLLPLESPTAPMQTPPQTPGAAESSPPPVTPPQPPPPPPPPPPQVSFSEGAVAQPQQSLQPQRAYPLYSMPGLPPGVKAIRKILPSTPLIQSSHIASGGQNIPSSISSQTPSQTSESSTSTGGSTPPNLPFV
ncbi:MAG TPA: hypothetical protein VJB65_05280 [Patescibacteria group bacterium]|nr:hypothetical protein [Patescibacteria group bacterium]